MVKIFKATINGKEVNAKKGETIIQLCKRQGIEIPHLCHDDKLHPIGACRLCVVEVEGARSLLSSCTTPIMPGMKVKTHTPKILEARRINLELLLANHDLNCTICVRNLDCKLQTYSKDMMVNKIRYEGDKRISIVDETSSSIRRDNNKCILCEKCIRVCNEQQTVYAIGLQNRGFNTKVMPPQGKNMSTSNCINCGQCVIACPTGALSEISEIQPVIDALNSGKILVAQTAPSIRATLGECFGMPAGTPVTGKMVSALKQIGFDYVFDTDLGADLTIIEEATEFVKRFKANKNLPMITTCCPAWVKFGEQFFFEELGHMSSCRSPQAMLSSLVKTYFAKKIKKKPEDIILVDIMPCTAKKYEIKRPEFTGEADYVLTTVEIAKLLKQLNVDFVNLHNTDFDHPLGESTGAGAIFGRTGGVMEAAIRTAADFISGKDLKEIEYKQVQGMDHVKEATLKLAGKEIKIGVVHTLGEARKIMEDIKAGTSPYHFIEIMACYGGCIGGGGQPRPHDDITLMKRAKALNKEDKSKKIRKSHKNPTALKLYKDYLGVPGGKKAHKLLHTYYTKKKHF